VRKGATWPAGYFSASPLSVLVESVKAQGCKALLQSAGTAGTSLECRQPEDACQSRAEVCDRRLHAVTKTVDAIVFGYYAPSWSGARLGREGIDGPAARRREVTSERGLVRS
jgi:hypothetical protein